MTTQSLDAEAAVALVQKAFGAYGTHTPRDVVGRFLARKDSGGPKDVTGARHRIAISMGLRSKDDVAPAADSGMASKWVQICKFDEAKGIVFGVVYEPDQLDIFGEFMTREDIELMAHRFMKLDLANAIDTQHDNIANGAYPIESFIAREGDPDYPEGAWVLGLKLTDDLKKKVDDGDLNGFSFQSLTTPVDVDVEYDAYRDAVGMTEVTNDHEHAYFVQMDDLGKVTGGATDEVDGHSHRIRRTSVTEAAGGHTHRFFM